MNLSLHGKRLTPSPHIEHTIRTHIPSIEPHGGLQYDNGAYN